MLDRPDLNNEESRTTLDQLLRACVPTPCLVLCSETLGLDFQHAKVAMIDLDNEYPDDPLHPGRVLLMFVMNKTLGRGATDLLCQEAKKKEKALGQKQRSIQTTSRLQVGRLTVAISEGSAAPPAPPADKTDACGAEQDKGADSGHSAKSGESVVIDLTKSSPPKREHKSRKLHRQVDIDLT
jgi:hypothetical protein